MPRAKVQRRAYTRRQPQVQKPAAEIAPDALRIAVGGAGGGQGPSIDYTVGEGGGSGGMGPAPQRADLRAPMREEDSRSRAARRAKELREHIGDADEGTDDFFIDTADIPDGWDYQWKRETVYGAEDPAYQVSLRRTGWEPVPAERHPAYMPEGARGPIRRKGMILMERPKEISDEARARELRKARLQVRTKEEQLNQAPAGTLPRDEDSRTRARINKSYEAMPVPE